PPVTDGRPPRRETAPGARGTAQPAPTHPHPAHTRRPHNATPLPTRTAHGGAPGTACAPGAPPLTRSCGPVGHTPVGSSAFGSSALGSLTTAAGSPFGIASSYGASLRP